MMDRRLFFRRASLIAAGVAAADQVELLERLTWNRTVFPSATIVTPGSITDTELSALLKKVYSDLRYNMMFGVTPLAQVLRDKHDSPQSLFGPPKPRTVSWGGTAHYFDVVVDRRCPPKTVYLA